MAVRDCARVYWEALLDLAEEEDGSEAGWHQPESQAVAWLWLWMRVLTDPENVRLSGRLLAVKHGAGKNGPKRS